MGSRTLKNGIEAVVKLKSERLTNVEVVPLDVTDEHSVKSVWEEIGIKQLLRCSHQ
ncbi:hypothetical protein ACFFGQ_12435 [Rufibacter quisquiliarum]